MADFIKGEKGIIKVEGNGKFEMRVTSDEVVAYATIDKDQAEIIYEMLKRALDK